MEAIRVLVADDHIFFRDGIRALLTAAPEVELVGEAGTGDEAVDLALRLQPDVVLMDVQMPGCNGIEATRRITSHSPHIGILVVTMFDDDTNVFQAMRAGARGYLLKGANHMDLLRAIHAVGKGEAIFSPQIAMRMMEFFANMRPTSSQVFPELTEREREILALIGEGAKNAEIAERLFLAPKTVRNHVSNILSKLQVVDRAQAAIRAREAGLV